MQAFLVKYELWAIPRSPGASQIEKDLSRTQVFLLKDAAATEGYGDDRTLWALAMNQLARTILSPKFADRYYVHIESVQSFGDAVVLHGSEGGVIKEIQDLTDWRSKEGIAGD